MLFLLLDNDIRSGEFFFLKKKKLHNVTISTKKKKNIRISIPLCLTDSVVLIILLRDDFDCNL